MRVAVHGIELDYRIEGSGRVVALGHSLGLARDIFDPMRPMLGGRGRLITWDARGHGRSQKTAEGWTIEDLASDLAGLLEHVGAERAVVGGLSMGGCTALALALAHPEAVEALVLMDTTAGYDEAARAAWEERAANVETRGLEPVVAFNLPRWFSDDFLRSSPEVVGRIADRLRGDDPSSFAAACRALGAFDVRDRLSEIRCPTLVLVGAEDPATPPAMAELLHERLPRSELHVLPGLRHLAPVEAPERVGRLIASFLERL